MPAQMLMGTAAGHVMEESHVNFHLPTDSDCENFGFYREICFIHKYCITKAKKLGF
jgi:hypothetical protein